MTDSGAKAEVVYAELYFSTYTILGSVSWVLVYALDFVSKTRCLINTLHSDERFYRNAL